MRAVRVRAILNNVNTVSRSPRVDGGHIAGPTGNVHRYARLGARCANRLQQQAFLPNFET